MEILKSWSGLASRYRWIIGLCVFSVIFTGAYIVNKNPINPGAPSPLNFLNVAGMFLFGEIVAFLNFLWEFSRLSSKIALIEIGEPVEKTFEKEVKEALEEG